MKKFLCTLLSVSMLLASLPVLAADEDADATDDSDELKDSIILLVDANSCFVNGELTSVGDVNPTIVEGRTLVPARFLAESLGGIADWDAASKTATLTVDSDVIQIPIDTNTIIVNGSEQQLDVGGTILNDRTMMPLRSICEALGKNVEYQDGMILIGSTDFSRTQNSLSPNVSSYILRNASAPLEVTDSNPNRLIQTLAASEVCINGDSFTLPYESEKDTCLYSVGGMYVENMTINKSGTDTYYFTMDIYNTDYSYGAVEVYGNDGELKSAEMIEPFDGGVNTTNVKKYITTVWDYALNVKNAIVNKDFSYIEYRNATVSKENSISFDVPYDGYILITSNANDSYNVCMYNTVHAITETIDVASNITDSLSAADSKLLKAGIEKYLKKLLSENEEIGNELMEKITEKILQKNMTPWNAATVISELGQDIFDIAKDVGIDIEGIIKESAGDALSGAAQDTILNAIAASGLSAVKIGFDVGDAISGFTNLICFFMDYSYTTSCDSVVIDLAPYKAAYKEFLLESDEVYRKSDSFGFVYVDDNDVPELVISHGFAHVSTADLYTYVDDEVKPVNHDGNNSYGDYGTMVYKERGSLICLNHSVNRYGFISIIYSMDKDTATEQHNFSDIFTDEEDVYYWNDAEISAETYKTETARLTEGYASFGAGDAYSISEENIDKAFEELLTK